MGTSPRGIIAFGDYAVGVIAYELLVGRHPFDLKNLYHELFATTAPDLTPLQALSHQPSAPAPLFNVANEATFLHTTSDSDSTHPIPPPVPMPNPRSTPVAPTNGITLSSIVGKLLEKTPERRYQKANAVIRDLYTTLGEPLPAEPADIRESFLQAAKFVGRKSEFQTLQEALHHALTGQGSVWLVGGESGVGKSRLLNELRTYALVEAANPNGAVANVAGIRNERGNVMGLMPHPEHAVEASLGGTDGAAILGSLVDALGSAR